ncbi:hypothetical protein [Gandjariella thermophila]|uniref:ESX-1 secretion-associated protein EspA/EspE-like domain-containing protein n=1 Tax=Gandjariella thermophila TaxID=1931992 RepID=A0A4D4JF35_9PSEU|nr:hypothetical protein [Gandjariella thermophila]GDY33268.1 hypothetical protein GTS_49010 [Gandjariella thermophila]
MVSFTDLRDAKPRLWQRAADDLLRLAKEAEQAASDIYHQGKGAVDEHWTDEVGQHATEKLKALVDDYEAAAITVRAGVSVLDGLSEGVDLAQQSLLGALDFAKRSGLQVDDQGLVHVPAANTDPTATHNSQQAQQLINDALARAARVDNDAAEELAKLVGALTNTDVNKALNTTQAEAAEDQVKLIRDSLPVGKSAAEVLPGGIH